MEKVLKFIIAISLLILAFNSFRVVSYLHNLTELMGALVNTTN